MSGLDVFPRGVVVEDEAAAPTPAETQRAQQAAARAAGPSLVQRWRQKRAVAFVLEVVRVFSDAHVLQLAAAIAFFVLLSLGPVVLVLLSVAGFVFGDDAVHGRVFGALSGVVGESSALFVQELVERSAGGGQGVAAVVGLLLFLWTSSGVFAQVSDALAVVRRVASGKTAQLKPAEPSTSKWRRLAMGGWGLVRSRVISVGVIVLSATLLLLTMLASSVISVMTSRFDAWIDVSGLIASASSVVSLLLFTAFTTVLYRLLPTPRLPLRAAAVGGVVAAVLFLVARSFVGNAVAHMASESSFGTAASVIAVLVWAWFSATILLVGCAAGSVADEQHQRRLVNDAPAGAPGSAVADENAADDADDGDDDGDDRAVGRRAGAAA